MSLDPGSYKARARRKRIATWRTVVPDTHSVAGCVDIAVVEVEGVGNKERQSQFAVVAPEASYSSTSVRRNRDWEQRSGPSATHNMMH